MKMLKIYDPAMCCSSGVCGPSPDSQLMKLSEDIAFLKENGVSVDRYNLAHQANMFTENPQILAEMGAEGEHLPIFMVDNEVKSKGRYPNRKEMAEWFGIEAATNPEGPDSKLTTSNKKRCCCC